MNPRSKELIWEQIYANAIHRVDWRELNAFKKRNYKTSEAINFKKTLFLIGQKTIGFFTDKEFCGYV
jgi:hypothetical protein